MNKLISNSGDYFAVSTYDIYGTEFTGREEWVVVSDRCPAYLLEQYPATMNALSPYILLTTAQWSVFEAELKLNDKFRKQYERHELKAKYVDQIYIQEQWSYEAAMSRYEEMMDMIFLKDAWEKLTCIQRRRMRMHFFEGMTTREIAEAEGASHQSVCESIKNGKKKIQIYLNAYPAKHPSSVQIDRRTK